MLEQGRILLRCFALSKLASRVNFLLNLLIVIINHLRYRQKAKGLSTWSTSENADNGAVFPILFHRCRNHAVGIQHLWNHLLKANLSSGCSFYRAEGTASGCSEGKQLWGGGACLTAMLIWAIRNKMGESVWESDCDDTRRSEEWECCSEWSPKHDGIRCSVAQGDSGCLEVRSSWM